MGFCWDEDEHRRQARDDFSRGGEFGYDRERGGGFGDRWDDCDLAYPDQAAIAQLWVGDESGFVYSERLERGKTCSEALAKLEDK